MVHATTSDSVSSYTHTTDQICKNNLASFPHASAGPSGAHSPELDSVPSPSSQYAANQQRMDDESASSYVPNQPLLHHKVPDPYPGLQAPSPSIELKDKVDAKSLSFHLSRWLDQKYIHGSGRWGIDVWKLNKFIVEFTPRLNADDLSHSTSRDDIWYLLKSFNTVFFDGEISLASPSQFHWLQLHDNRILAMCCADQTHTFPTIYLHPRHIDYWKHVEEYKHPAFPMRDRLSSLLHELCHALFISRCEPSSSSWRREVGVGGHGPAWRRIARTIERVSLSILGLRLDLGRDANRIHDGRHLSISYKRRKATTPKNRITFRHQSLDILRGRCFLLCPSRFTLYVKRARAKAKFRQSGVAMKGGTGTTMVLCANSVEPSMELGTRQQMLPAEKTQECERERTKAESYQSINPDPNPDEKIEKDVICEEGLNADAIRNADIHGLSASRIEVQQEREGETSSRRYCNEVQRRWHGLDAEPRGCNAALPARQSLTRLPSFFGQGKELVIWEIPIAQHPRFVSEAYADGPEHSKTLQHFKYRKKQYPAAVPGIMDEHKIVPLRRVSMQPNPKWAEMFRIFWLDTAMFGIVLRVRVSCLYPKTARTHLNRFDIAGPGGNQRPLAGLSSTQEQLQSKNVENVTSRKGMEEKKLDKEQWKVESRWWDCSSSLVREPSF